MKLEAILYLIGIILSLLFISLNVWRAYVHYSNNKPVNLEPFIFAILSLSLVIRIPYLIDKPLSIIFYTLSTLLSLIITLLYTLSIYND